MPPQASSGSAAQASLAGPSTPPAPAHASPAALRHLVLDYLTHAGYKGTALALARDGARDDDDLQALQHGLAPSSAAARAGDSAMAPPPRAGGDKDGDEEMDGGAAAESNGASNGGSNGNGKAASPAGAANVGELSAKEIEQMGWRSEIRSLILHGDIYASLALLDKHFPAVLDPPSFRFSDTLGETSISPRMGLPAYASSLDPAHLALNLQIQAFIESVRNSSHPGASDDSTPTSSRSGSASPTSASASTPPGERDGNGAEPAMEDEAGGRGEGVYGALHLVQSINARVQRLPEYWRSMYLKELEGVTALLAYGDLKHCPVRKYLDQHRRTALAEQINCAILVSCGRASQPLLEAAVRQTTFVWARMAEERIAVPANHPLLASTPARSHWLESGETTSSSQQYTPATSEDPRKLRGRILPPWDLHTFLAER